MLLETGTFSGNLLSDCTISEVFSARVVIPDSEFAPLALGDYERPSELSAGLRWCFDVLGPGGTHWVPELADLAVAIVHFKRDQDTIAFVAQWNIPKSTSFCSAGGASVQHRPEPAFPFGEAHAGIFDDASDSQQLDWHGAAGPARA